MTFTVETGDPDTYDIYAGTLGTTSTPTPTSKGSASDGSPLPVSSSGVDCFWVTKSGDPYGDGVQVYVADTSRSEAKLVRNAAGDVVSVPFAITPDGSDSFSISLTQAVTSATLNLSNESTIYTLSAVNPSQSLTTTTAANWSTLDNWMIKWNVDGDPKIIVKKTGCDG